MTGTSTWAAMSGTARAASSLFTVTRTSSLPAWCNARTCATVAATSAVSVLVIDWTTIGWAPPTGTPPTPTVTVGRREVTGGNIPARGRRAGAPRLQDLVLQNDAQLERGQDHPAGDGRQPRVRALGHQTDPRRRPAEHVQHRRRQSPAYRERAGVGEGHGRLRNIHGEPRREVRARRVRRDVELEADRAGSGGIDQVRDAGHRRGLHDGTPEPRRQADLLHLRGAPRGARGDDIGDRVLPRPLDEAVDVHIEDRTPFAARGREQRGGEDEGGSCRFHTVSLIERDGRGHGDATLVGERVAVRPEPRIQPQRPEPDPTTPAEL